jgi:hypothetical protein
MRRLREISRGLMRKLRVSRGRRRAVNRATEQRRFEERQSLHEAGIYEPPQRGVL